MLCDICGSGTHDTMYHAPDLPESNIRNTSPTYPVSPTPTRFPHIGAATFVVKGTDILLGRSKKLNNQIVIPGGEIQPFEPVNDTARREILEETGIACLVADILFVSELVDPPNDHRIVIYMLAQYVDGEPVAGDDLSEAFWCDSRKLADYQDQMTDMTLDAICKFAISLKARGMAK